MRLFAVILMSLLALPASAEKISLAAISQYLNAMTTAQGAFTQINEDGTISQGSILIKRPGRMRFEYQPPDDALVIAAQQAVYIIDKKSNQAPETYPLRRTPLSLILARTVDLGRANMVTGHSFDGTATVVTAQDPENPDFGNIKLMFTGNPVELRQWVITDENGISTTVILGELKKGGTIRNSNFDISVYQPE